jgi:hypothetical protein
VATSCVSSRRARISRCVCQFMPPPSAKSCPAARRASRTFGAVIGFSEADVASALLIALKCHPTAIGASGFLNPSLATESHQGAALAAKSSYRFFVASRPRNLMKLTFLLRLGALVIAQSSSAHALDCAKSSFEHCANILVSGRTKLKYISQNS